MLISANNLKNIISTRLASSPGGLDLCQLANANTEVSTAYRVSSYNNLPPAICNTGKFAYANDENVLYLSNGTSWSTNFESNKQPTDILIGKIWGEWATCQAPLTNLACDAPSGCIFSPASVNFCYPDMYTAESLELGQYSMFYVKNGIGYAWGCNGSSQLGTGDSICRASPTIFSTSISNWKKISFNTSYTLGITTTGCVYSWGSNNYGQLGNCTTIARGTPGTTCLPGGVYCDVCAFGRCSSMAINTSGTAWAWGKNYYGQLGVGDATDCNSPRTICGGNWCKIAGGYYETLGLRTDGTLWGWGFNSGGQLGVGDTTSRTSPTQVAGGGTTWCDVATAGSNAGATAAIKTDGTLWTWGNGANFLLDGTLSNRSSPGTASVSPLGWSKVYSDTFGSGMYGIKTDGTLWAWGSSCCFTHGFSSGQQSYCLCGPTRLGSPNEVWLTFSIHTRGAIGVATKVSGF